MGGGRGDLKGGGGGRVGERERGREEGTLREGEGREWERGRGERVGGGRGDLKGGGGGRVGERERGKSGRGERGPGGGGGRVGERERGKSGRGERELNGRGKRELNVCERLGPLSVHINGNTAMLAFDGCNLQQNSL